MPICIECSYPVSELYHVLRSNKSAAPTPKPSNPNLASAPSSYKPAVNAPKPSENRSKTTSGTDVRLTQCPRCKRFADKYVEHDFVVLFIDLVLVKPQVNTFGLLPWPTQQDFTFAHICDRYIGTFCSIDFLMTTMGWTRLFYVSGPFSCSLTSI